MSKKYKSLADAFEDDKRQMEAEIARMRVEAEAAAQTFGSAVEAHIHRDTGRLAMSTDVNIHNTPDSFSATVSVGGPEAPYAVYENARRGHSLFPHTAELAYQNTLNEIFGGRPVSDEGSTHHSGRQTAD